MTSVLQEIITLLTSGITQVASGIGGGLQELVEGIFLDSSGASPVLSTFGGVIIIFAGIALALGLCRWVTNWISSMGN
ncbi:MAG: hypothetical protein QXY78_03920 [Thermoplasmata archaeon]